jgi:endoglucanase
MAPLAFLSLVPLFAAWAQASWVPPASPGLSRNNAPKWQSDVEVRAAGNTSQWPYGPFKTQGRDIVNSRGEVLSWAGINWPMSGQSQSFIRSRGDEPEANACE